MNRSIRIFLGIFISALITLPLFVTTNTGRVQAENHLLQPPLPGEIESGQLPPIAPGVVIVGLKSPLTVSADGLSTQSGDPSLDAALTTLGVQALEPLFPASENALTVSAVNASEIDLSHIYRVHLSPDTDVMQAVKELSSNPAVAYAEPDYQAHIIATPNDPLYSGQWGLAQINAPAAWDVVTGTTEVVVAVVDSGIDTSHPDLVGQLWVNPGEVAGNGIDDDNNGYIDDINGWNILDDNNDLTDNTGHGTEVAGVIAAITDNGTGVAGLCWNCRLMPVKVSQSSGAANYSDVAAGIIYAAEKGAKVINLSLGGYSDSATLRAAVAAASQTAVVIGGTGNDNINTEFYPAAYNDYVLAVSGIISDDTKSSTSNFGGWVDVSAPGEVITTTFSRGGYGVTSGTSMAAPFASGLAGLIRGQHPGWSANMARAQVVQTTDNIDGVNPAYAGQLGSGRINAGQAVTTEAVPDLVYDSYSVDGELAGHPEPGSTVDLKVTVFNKWVDATNVQAVLTTSDPYVTIISGTASYGEVKAYEKGTNDTPFRVDVLSSVSYAYDIPLVLNVTGDDGYSATIPFTVTTANGIHTVSGVLASDQIWRADQIHIVTGNVLVPSGITLTIEAGSEVRFDYERYLRVDGTLNAVGTKDKEILFTSTTPMQTLVDQDQPTSLNNQEPYQISAITALWEGIKFEGTDASGIIAHAQIQHAYTGIDIYQSSPTIRDSIFTRCQHALIIRHSKSPFFNNTISLNDFGLDIGDSNTTVSNNIFIRNSVGLLFDMGVTPKIISNTFYSNHTAFQNWEPSEDISIIHNNFYHNTWHIEQREEFVRDLDLPNNWWNTTENAIIDAHIYDYLDDFNLALVTYTPILDTPNPTSPPVLHDLSLGSDNTFGIQQVTFDLIFSGPMDQSLDPVVSFGTTSPYTTFFVTDNMTWLDETHWQATYDITSLIPRGTYTVSVSNAWGTDGMEIPTDTRYDFTVDYAGQITDQTPPSAPYVNAGGSTSDSSYIAVSWSANDSDSAITKYRYAVGSAAGATDIINWTTTTDTSVSRIGLGFIQDKQYWVAVQAQNAGGLWSTSGYKSFIAGQEQAPEKVFLPVILKP